MWCQKKKCWKISRFLFKLQNYQQIGHLDIPSSPENAGLTPVPIKAMFPILVVFISCGASMRMITNLYLSNESLHLNCEFSHNSHNRLSKKDGKNAAVLEKERKTAQHVQGILTCQNTQSPFHIHKVIQAWSLQIYTSMQMQLLLPCRLRPNSGMWRASCLDTAGEPPEHSTAAGMFTGAHAEERKAHGGEEEECWTGDTPKTSLPTREMIK